MKIITNSRRLLLSALLISMFHMAQMGSADAQEKNAKNENSSKSGQQNQGTGDSKKTKVKIQRRRGGRKVYRIVEEIRIEGKIQKPEAFYVLQKSGINYDWQELKKDFLPKILDSVKRAPF